MRKLIYITTFLLTIPAVSAHCPLCTIGAAAAAGGAAYLGVGNIVIGLFLGAFAMSMGLWFARLIKKKYIPFQNSLVVLISFITTLIPIRPMLSDFRPLYISWLGQYGTTFAIDIFLIGSILGGIIVTIAPKISSKITKLRNGKFIPYQGMLLTFGILSILGVIIQLLL